MWSSDGFSSLIQDEFVKIQDEKEKTPKSRYGLLSGTRSSSAPRDLVSTTSAAKVPGLCEVIDAIGGAICSIADLVATSRMENYHNLYGDTNKSGDDQTQLDVLSNKIFIEYVRSTGKVAMLVSEEEEGMIEGTPGAELVVVFDPLDGSSNIECGLSVGTLFGIFLAKGTDDINEVLRSGTEMVAAGYALYGAATTLVIATSLQEPVLSFSRNPCTGLLQQSGVIVMPNKPKKILSVNAGNYSKWDQRLSEVVQDAISGENPFAFRYVGSFVADLHRTLLYGGLFMYPADSKNKNGKLRMLYECFPAAFVTEAAGGTAFTNKGNERLLNSKPNAPHARCPVFLGSTEYIEDLAEAISAVNITNAHDHMDTNVDTPPAQQQQRSWKAAIIIQDVYGDESEGLLCVQKGETVLVDTAMPLSDPTWVFAKSHPSGVQGVLPQSAVHVTSVPLSSMISSDLGFCVAQVLGDFEGEVELGEMSVKKGQVVFVCPDQLSDSKWSRITSIDLTEKGIVPANLLSVKKSQEQPIKLSCSDCKDLFIAVESPKAEDIAGNLTVSCGDVLRGCFSLSDSEWISVIHCDSSDLGAIKKNKVMPVSVPLACYSPGVGFGTAIVSQTYYGDSEVNELSVREGDVVLVDPSSTCDKLWVRVATLDLSENGLLPREILQIRSQPNRPSLIETDFLSSLKYKEAIFYNLPSDTLKSLAIELGDAIVSCKGTLVVRTGERTGRSANDRFIVDNGENIHWGNVNKKISAQAFNRIRACIISHFATDDKALYVQDVLCGNDFSEALPVRVVTTSAWHSMFTRTMFVTATEDFIPNGNKAFTVLHAPHYKADEKETELNSACFVIINFKEREVLIGGTQYAGEIKKAIFSIMNLRLPQKGILSLHSAANIGMNGSSALFFGLSGTGKTTLSADPSRALIGDDEIAWSESGVFNLEGGCYAKLINITQESEPEIYGYCHESMTIMENVILNADNEPLFIHDENTALTTNTRAAYPLSMVRNLADGAVGGHPSHVIFLTCDASGVLPPMSKLTREQAAYYFISGYTSKTPGTEVGVTSPTPTFSACFGEAFMPLHPGEYASLLIERLQKYGTKTWLLNTGWTGGAYGTGKRISLKHTRSMLKAILDGHVDNTPTLKDSYFGLEIPKFCPNVPSELLQPQNTWSCKQAYATAAASLVHSFTENFKKYSDDVPPEIIAAGPKQDTKHDYYDYDYTPETHPYFDRYTTKEVATWRDYQKARIEFGPDY